MHQHFRCLVFYLIFKFLLCAAQKQYGTANFGDPCKRDVDCIKNAFCRGQSFCQCEQHYAPSAERTICLATAGLSCIDDSTCITMSNAMCRQNVCACKDSYTLDMNNSSNCIRSPTREGDVCQKRDDCEETMERAICVNNECHCINGHRFVNATGTCIQARLLYFSCKHDYECFLDDGTPNVLICKNGECSCKDGGCNGGLSVVAAISLLMSLLLMVRTI